MGLARNSVNLALRLAVVTHCADGTMPYRRLRQRSPLPTMEHSRHLADQGYGQADSSEGEAVENALRLAEALRRGDARDARRCLDARLEDGVAVDTLLRSDLVAAARLLGDFWSADTACFTEVTQGVGILQRLHRELADRDARPPALGDETPRILLAPAPGEQHDFGTSLAGTLLHRAGWDVTLVHAPSPARILASVAGGWFEVVGLSIASERHIEALGTLMRHLRSASANAQAEFVIGGWLAQTAPALLAEVGADRIIDDIEILEARAQHTPA